MASNLAVVTVKSQSDGPVAPLLASAVRGKQGRSARRDQQAVKLEGLSPAEQVDLFRPECDELAS